MEGLLLLEKNIQEVQSTGMSTELSESCHDHASGSSTSSVDDSTEKHRDCCEEPCMCVQSGCHSPVATIGGTSSSFNNLSADFYSKAVNYLSPTLTSQTPPPII